MTLIETTLVEINRYDKNETEELNVVRKIIKRINGQFRGLGDC